MSLRGALLDVMRTLRRRAQGGPAGHRPRPRSCGLARAGPHAP
ncbi:hypothetical protein PJP10_05410 [Mycobacterium kansasii]